jgi:hypothetical protein
MRRTLCAALATTACALLPATAGAAPTARFTWTPASPAVNQAVSFDGSTSSCDRSPCTYSWRDDGPDGPGGASWPLGTGVGLTFTFRNAGTKFVGLTVRNRSGSSSSVEHNVVVSSTPPPPPPADADGDGVEDSSDQCPGTPAGTQVDATGCPVVTPPPPPPPADADGDGVEDSSDQCPGTPAGTQVDATGCPVVTPPPPPPPPPGDCPAWPGFPTSGATSAGCTGYRHTGVTLTAYSGPSSITTAGTTIDGKDITSCLTINAPNVTITRSYIHCGGGIVVNSTGFLIEDSEINGNGSPGCDWLLGSNRSNTSLTARRIYLYDCSDGFRVNGQFTLEDSYLDGLYNNAGDHNDGMQGYGPGGTATLRHNHLDGRTQNLDGMNGVIFFADAWNGNVTITQNLLAGGGFALKLHENGHYWVDSNRVLAGSYSYGPALTTFGVIESWTDNRLVNADGSDGAAFSP